MNKRNLILSAILILILTACGSTQNNTSNTRQFNSTQSSNFSTQLPVASKIAVGTFKLTDANLTITPKEATNLLPLWQVYRELSTSDTAAQEEIDALVQQIQETMTPGQIQAIDGMNLTQRDVFTFMREQGISFGNGTGANGTQGNQGNSANAQNQGNSRRFQGGGNFPPGGFGGSGGPGGGFAGGGGQGFSPQQIATAQARRAANGGGFGSTRVPAPLVEALIKMLQQKAGS